MARPSFAQATQPGTAGYRGDPQILAAALLLSGQDPDGNDAPQATAAADRPYTPRGRQVVTVDGTVKALTRPGNATHAVVLADPDAAAADGIAYALEGAGAPPTPTDCAGKLKGGVGVMLPGSAACDGFRVTRVTGVSVPLLVEWRSYP